MDAPVVWDCSPRAGHIQGPLGSWEFGPGGAPGPGVPEKRQESGSVGRGGGSCLLHREGRAGREGAAVRTAHCRDRCLDAWKRQPLSEGLRAIGPAGGQRVATERPWTTDIRKCSPRRATQRPWPGREGLSSITASAAPPSRESLLQCGNRAPFLQDAPWSALGAPSPASWPPSSHACCCLRPAWHTGCSAQGQSPLLARLGMQGVQGPTLTVGPGP